MPVEGWQRSLTVKAAVVALESVVILRVMSDRAVVRTVYQMRGCLQSERTATARQRAARAVSLRSTERLEPALALGIVAVIVVNNLCLRKCYLEFRVGLSNDRHPHLG